MPGQTTLSVTIDHPSHASRLDQLDRSAVDASYRYWRTRVMYGMMSGYAFFYFVRSNLSIASKAIGDEFHFSNTQWGLVLSVATIVYAFSKFFSGILAERCNPKYMMSAGLFASAAFNLAFGFGGSLNAFIVLWAMNNLFQGMGMPPCSRLLTSWFAPKEIGRKWGFWNASHQIGGAIIVVVAGYLVNHLGWRFVFWGPGAFCILASFWVFNRLTSTPESMGLPAVEIYAGEGQPSPQQEQGSAWENFTQHILWNKWVWIVSLANFFVYVVRIGIMDWAPKYLQEAKGFDIRNASFALSAFEMAGILGAYGSGWISDRIFLGRRGPVSVMFMMMLTFGLLLLILVPSGQAWSMSVLFAALGFCVYGPQLLVAVAAADFATKTAASSAVGLTGLLGYLGASFCGVATGWLVDRFGWNGALWFYSLSAVLGCLLLATTWFKTAENSGNHA